MSRAKYPDRHLTDDEVDEVVRRVVHGQYEKHPIPREASDRELDSLISLHMGISGGTCGPNKPSEWHRGNPPLIVASWPNILLADNRDPTTTRISGKRAIRAAVRKAWKIAEAGSCPCCGYSGNPKHRACQHAGPEYCRRCRGGPAECPKADCGGPGPKSDLTSVQKEVNEEFMGSEIIPPGEQTLQSMIDRHALRERFFDARAKALKGIFECGEILIEAKNGLNHGEWLDWLDDLGVGARSAQILMRIARDANLTRQMRTDDSHLPVDRMMLTELCGMEEERFDALVADGTIHAEMKRGDVRRALTDQRHDAGAPKLADLPAGKYRAILADPPWRFETWGDGGMGRSPESHYPTMSRGEIETLEVGPLAADDCALFLWVQSAQLLEAVGVMAAWGFDFRTTAFVWVKDDHPGLGYWTRRRSELCLLGTRGKPQRIAKDVDEVIHAPRGRHSQKPAEVYERIERLVPGPYLELFARERREGWDAWGNEPTLEPTE